MASNSHKSSSGLKVQVDSVENKKSSSSTSQQKEMSQSARGAPVSKGDTNQKRDMLRTTINVGDPADKRGPSPSAEPINSMPGVTNSGRASPATPGSAELSRTVGPSATLNVSEYDQKLQEQTKLLEARKMELDEKDGTINTITLALDDVKSKLELSDNKVRELEKKLSENKQISEGLENEVKANMADRLQLRGAVDERESYIAQLTEALNNEKHKRHATKEKAKLEEFNNNETIQQLKAERNELRSRLSKAASDKLTAGGNADIADLSDPNRAMKLSERFSGIYDDEWTDAFETLTQKYKQDPKVAIQLLLSFLRSCFDYCKQTEQGQMDALKNVVMHPCQSASQDVKAGKDKVNIGSTELKTLKDLRRRIATNSSYEVKAQCLSQLKKQYVRKDADGLAAASAYCEKCVELCWLMVLHDPPLHMTLEVKSGTKMDHVQYSSYASPGDTIDYLVWPSLFNGLGGGLLAKGAAAPIPSKKKVLKK